MTRRSPGAKIYFAGQLMDVLVSRSFRPDVDLNPIRADMAIDLATSEHTSISRRLKDGEARPRSLKSALGPFVGMAGQTLSVRTLEYLELVDWSGRKVRADKRGAIVPAAPPVLARLGLRERAWHAQMLGMESRYWRAVGTVESLAEKAKALGQCWLKRMGRSGRPMYG